MAPRGETKARDGKGTTASRRRRRPAPPRVLDPALVTIVAEEFRDDTLALELFAEFLGRRRDQEAFAGRLVTIAAARAEQPSWSLRRAAVLMLETLLCSTSEGDFGAFEHILSAISGGARGEPIFPPSPSVLAEGYTSCEPAVFLGELRRRLGRLARVHRVISGPTTSAETLREFLEMARQECRLTLARYFFTPEEVVRRVFDQVRTSRGQWKPFDSASIEEVAVAFLSELPAYERNILAAFVADPSILWAGDATSSRLNALVEYPIGTVVLVVKPPGSSLEIEIKRAGRQGDHPLSVVYERNSVCVPPSHRLDGGSLGGATRAEAGAAAFLDRMYRIIQGGRPPFSRTIAHRTIQEIPCASGRAHVLDFFTAADVFGDGFESMRRAMALATEAFCREWNSERLGLPGEMGLTMEFLSQTSPTQAVLGGSTSYRLDLLASYLGDEGPDRYFRDGLGVEPTPGEVRRFANTLLDEILGEFVPLPVGDASHGSYIDAMLAHPENRRRADAVFLALAEQIGRLWGTLFGLGGRTSGESFVGRNVGLKSAWEGGRWCVHFIAMDHDMMWFPRGHFDPGDLLRRWGNDADHIHGQPGDPWKSALDWLVSIYRLDEEMAARGRAVLLRAASEAARLSRHLRASDERVRGQYEPKALKAAQDWEAAAVVFIQVYGSGAREEDALSAARALLEGRGRDPQTVESWTGAIRKHATFLQVHAGLLGVDPPTTGGVAGRKLGAAPASGRRKDRRAPPSTGSRTVP